MNDDSPSKALQKEWLKLYKDLFGYTPEPSQYKCSVSEFYTYLNICIRELKEMSTYVETETGLILDGTRHYIEET